MEVDGDENRVKSLQRGGGEGGGETMRKKKKMEEMVRNGGLKRWRREKNYITYIRSCYITVDFAMAASQNRISTCSFPFIRIPVPLTSALLNLPKGKSLGRSKPATNS